MVIYWSKSQLAHANSMGITHGAIHTPMQLGILLITYAAQDIIVDTSLITCWLNYDSFSAPFKKPALGTRHSVWIFNESSVYSQTYNKPLRAILTAIPAEPGTTNFHKKFALLGVKISKHFCLTAGRGTTN